MKTKTLILVILQTFLFGSVFIFTRNVIPPLNAYSYVFLRMLIGLFAQSIFFIKKRFLKEFFEYLKKNLKDIIVISFLSVTSYILMFYSTPFTTSTNQSLLNSFCSVIIVLMNLLIYRKKPSNNIIISTIFTTIGIILVLIPFNFSNNNTIKGDLLVLVSMIISALYAIKVEEIRKKSSNSIFISIAINIFSVLFLLPFQFYESQYIGIFSLSKIQWIIIIWLGVMLSGLGLWINSELYSDDEIQAEHVGIFVSLIVVFGVILGVIIYNDYLNEWNIIGIIFIISAIYISQKKKKVTMIA